MSAPGTVSNLIKLRGSIELDTTKAACVGYLPDLWFPDHSGPKASAAAVMICNTCPIKTQCAQVAITHRIREGVWGGLTEQQRDRIFRGRATL